MMSSFNLRTLRPTNGSAPGGEVAGLVHRAEHRQSGPLADLEVLLAVSGAVCTSPCRPHADERGAVHDRESPPHGLEDQVEQFGAGEPGADLRRTRAIASATAAARAAATSSRGRRPASRAYSPADPPSVRCWGQRPGRGGQATASTSGVPANTPRGSRRSGRRRGSRASGRPRIRSRPRRVRCGRSGTSGSTSTRAARSRARASRANASRMLASKALLIVR